MGCLPHIASQIVFNEPEALSHQNAALLPSGYKNDNSNSAN